MNKIIVRGTPYEQGVQQGELLQEIIQRNVDLVKEMLDNKRVDQEKYKQFIDANVDFLNREHTEIMEEIRGIAKGSKIPYDDIVLLNIPAYFMKDYFLQECSMLLVRGKATQDGSTYIIKNRDMSTYLQQVVVRREYPDGLIIAEVNGAGTVTYPAGSVNSHGVCMTNTGFWSAKAVTDVDRVGSGQITVNSHLILRHCRTADESLQYLLENPRINGLNVIIADQEKAYLIELTKDDAYVEEDTGEGVLFRSNHYISEKLSWLNPEPEVYASTFKRYDRMKELVGECYGRIRFQDLFRIMSDHANGVNAICRHPSEEAPAQTISSTLIALEDIEIWSTVGNPCEQLPNASAK